MSKWTSQGDRRRSASRQEIMVDKSEYSVATTERLGVVSNMDLVIATEINQLKKATSIADEERDVLSVAMDHAIKLPSQNNPQSAIKSVETHSKQVTHQTQLHQPLNLIPEELIRRPIRSVIMQDLIHPQALYRIPC